MRLGSALRLLCLASICIPVALANAATPVELRRSFSLGATPQVEVSGVAGAITVVGKAQSQIELRAVKHGDDQQRVNIEIKTEGDRLEVRTRCPDPRGPDHWDGCGRVRVEYHLEVPRGTRLHCANVSGSLKVTEVQGAAHLKTVSGALSVERVGAVPLHLSSVSGAISARGATGELHASAVSGTIELWRPAGARGDVRASTVSGPVRIHVDRGADATLHFSTVSGALSSALPLHDESRTRSRLKATLGHGGPSLHASTVSGSVQVLPL